MMKSNTQAIPALKVWLYDRPIGIINRLAGDRHIFSFEQDYIDDPNRPTLSLSFKGQTSELITTSRITHLRLPPFFSNLLPEGYLRTYLAQRAGVKPEREFYLLEALGADLPGALTVTPWDVDMPIDIYQEPDLGIHQQDSVLRFSLAGIQLKFSAIMDTSGGLTVPADGMNGSWIVKLPSARFSFVPENEFVMLALAQAIGIELPQHQLLPMEAIHGLPEDAAHMQGYALAIQRFDRGQDGQRIHMEDFAQVFGLFPESKYEQKSYANIASVLLAEMGEEGVFEFMRRLVFSVLIGNADMHLKNWSILYPDKRTPVLAPGYDFVATLPYIQEDKLALSFGGSRSLNEVSPQQLRRFADTAGLPLNPLSQLVMETLERTVDAWRALPQKSVLPKDMRQAIERQIQLVAANTQRQFQ